MRSASKRLAACGSRLAAAALVGALGCGNYGNNLLDDALFVNALPRASDLQVTVPQTSSQPLCGPLEASKQPNDARNIAAGISTITGNILGLIDFIRQLPATTRTSDTRTWGPFPDEQHPGVQILVVMKKTSDSPVQFTFALRERRGASGDFTTVIAAQLTGAVAQKGAGAILFDWDAVNALGVDKATDPKTGKWQIAYDFTSDPKTVEWQVPATTAGGVSTVTDLAVAAYADGQLRLDLNFVDDAGRLVTATTRMLSSGAGRADYTLKDNSRVPPASDTLAECWDATYCRVYLYDIAGWFCGQAFCELGNKKQCPTVH